jgi:hypothetical protein
MSALDDIERRKAVAVRRIFPTLEVGCALFGKGGARLHQVALGAVLAQGAGQASGARTTGIRLCN